MAPKCEHRLCVLLQRTETNPSNKSHPSLCYLNTNYIIVHTSWQRGKNSMEALNKNRKCVLSGGGRG